MSKRYKKVISLLLVPVLILCIIASAQTAEAVGGTGGTGGFTPGGSGGIGGLIDELSDAGNITGSRSYKVELVYRPQGQAYYSIASAVVYIVKTGNRYYNVTLDYANHNTTTKKVLTSGTLYNLVKKIDDARSGGHGVQSYDVIAQLEASGYLEQNLKPENWVSELGLSVNDLSLVGDNEPGRLDSYGYRLLIQQVTIFASSQKTYAAPRKELAASSIPTGNKDGDFGYAPDRPSSYQGDLLTFRDDTGIYRGTNYSANRANYANRYSGLGYNIIWFPQESRNNLSPETDCTDCTDTTSGSSYIFKDTTIDLSRLKSMVNSYNSKGGKEAIVDHFSRTINGHNYICTEERQVNFPKNGVDVKTGRHFTVAAEHEDYSKFEATYFKDIPGAIPDTGKISVTRTIQCTPNGSGSYNPNEVYQYYKNQSNGKVSIKYDEQANEGVKDPYKTDYIELYEDKGADQGTAGQYSITKTNYYYFYQDKGGTTYQYIRKSDGKSVSTKPKEEYDDLGYPNFPVSYKNVGDDNKIAGYYYLKYDMDDSKMEIAYKNPEVFANDTKKETNIYYIALNKKLVNNTSYSCNGLTNEQCTELSNSACVKNRCKNGNGNCENLLSCFQNNSTSAIKTSDCYKKSTSDTAYKCPVRIASSNNDPNNPGGGLKCVVINNVYYDKDGNKTDKDTYNKQCGPDFCELYPNDPACPNNKGGELDPCLIGAAECPIDNLIYRPIDLTTPFPGQLGTGRLTGANWCGYDATSGQLNCKSSNGVVYYTITHNRQEENENLYTNKEPIYKFTLNATNIQNIRDYNSKTEYDDFTLDCDDDGSRCISKFISNSAYSESRSGSCLTSDRSKYYSCRNPR